MAVNTAVRGVRARTLTEAALRRLTLGLMVLWQIGGHVDAWYHLHRSFAIESFFTWPHALLYGGWAATGLVPTIYLLESIGLGAPRRAWLPRGYPAILLGAALFGLGGALISPGTRCSASRPTRRPCSPRRTCGWWCRT